ncbi:MAG: hypothetical protein A3J08_02070 [Candidatus Lloydbacteria bacterium RIFCSPLOWO2_02_FULL_51_11]|uniref:CxxC-x17-CxxC domain-containing protein n=1 Tax=Candidatus Lloydbacteria bacterium RIFCSPLOWO2_02_FULL_51_11 TaxID=1798667 RepID=A0A1G2DKC7_9BACT|nr:MAG: hypothetical protein A3J08_02070 [Candidatus Lloydbacteria bacterium RIFCSPLOWO2_02_FULL_51_11]
MFQGDWTCSGCGTPVKELPFQPKDTSNVTCRDCHMKSRGGNGGDTRGERKMVSGNWPCSGCGAVIKELPFQPRETGNLLCRDCFKKKKEGAR